MEGAFGWISSIIHNIGLVLPRLLHVQFNLGCVLFKRGGTKVLKPGMHIYWPIWSEPIRYPIKRQTLNLPPQVLTTGDGKTVTVSVTVVYEVSDIEKALVETFDLEETVTDVAQLGVKTVVLSHDYDDLKGNQEEIDKSLKKSIRSALHPHGAKVIEAFMSDFAPCFVFRNICG